MLVFPVYLALTVCMAVVSCCVDIPAMQSTLLLAAPFTTYILLGGWMSVYLFFATVWRDALAFLRYIKYRVVFSAFCNKTKSVHHAFADVARKHPDRPCFIFEKRKWTYSEVDEFSTGVAIVLRDKLQLKPGEVIALFMHNRPEYVGIWLGASKGGYVTALINTNIRLEVLLHSLKAAQCVALVYDQELSAAVDDVKESLTAQGIRHLVQWNDSEKVAAVKSGPLSNVNLFLELKQLREKNPRAISEFELFKAEPSRACLYIYTSGTTGMPKAAVLRHKKYFQFSKGAFIMFGLSTSDIIYDPLPLYHTAGGMIGVGMALLSGCTVVLRTRFSASQFWDECAAHRCTVAQYLGETCRYLLNQPERESDRAHCVRFMFGNGLRPQIWRAFQTRFRVKAIGEFYGATEGIANIINHMNKEGACGFLSVILPGVYPIALISVDTETGEPIRGRNGLCMECKPGEPGMMVGKIRPGLFDYDGYTDKAASEKKVLKDVFKKGDRAFASGDVLTTDRYGYLYFVDRIGDTFRWKGENVSTTEVEGVIINILEKQDVVVFGVEVPGCEGRAGMVAIKVDGDGKGENEIDLSALTEQLERRLPAYARPLFVRLVRSLEATGTFKLKKNELRTQGFKPDPEDSNTISLHVFLSDKRCYVPLTGLLYQSILDGKVRF